MITFEPLTALSRSALLDEEGIGKEIDRNRKVKSRRKLLESGCARLLTFRTVSSEPTSDLLALVTVLAQTLFALVRGHLMSLLFLSVRHGVMFLELKNIG